MEPKLQFSGHYCRDDQLHRLPRRRGKIRPLCRMRDTQLRQYQILPALLGMCRHGELRHFVQNHPLCTRCHSQPEIVELTDSIPLMLPGPFEGAGFFIAIDTHPTPYYPIIISIFPVLKCTEDVQKIWSWLCEERRATGSLYFSFRQ